MNQEVRSTLEQLKAKLYPQTQPTEKQMEHKQTPTPASIPTADLFKPMSVTKAITHCLGLGIDKPAAIQKLTGKPINQIYTGLWTVRNKAKKAKVKGVVITKSEPTTPKQKDQKYIAFLENRMSGWQAECRKQAHQIEELEAALAKAVLRANQPRNVTGEVKEVMEEVKQLRATVAYLESKLFGGK